MKQLNRWVYAIVGVIVLLFAGLVYAWSVLSTPIGAEFTGWTKAQLSLTFTLVMILFCIGSLLCGLLAGRLSAKNAVRLGAVLFLAGFFIASRCQSPLTLYLGFGVLCGLGSGLSYNAVMSTMVRWCSPCICWPRRRRFWHSPAACCGGSCPRRPPTVLCAC